MLTSEDKTSWSHLLHFLERHGIAPDDAKEAALTFYHWGGEAMLHRMCPSRPKIPADAPAPQLDMLEGGVIELRPKKPAKRMTMVKRRIPDDFTLDESRASYGLARGLTRFQVAEMFEEFRRWYRQTGKCWADWDAVWEGWVRRGVDKINDRKMQDQPSIDGRL